MDAAGSVVGCLMIVGRFFVTPHAVQCGCCLGDGTPLALHRTMTNRKSPIGELLYYPAEDATPVVLELRHHATQLVRTAVEAYRTREEAAETLGVTRGTLYRWLRDHPELVP